MLPVIIAAAPPTALLIKNFRRSMPGGISCEINSAGLPRRSSQSASSGFVSLFMSFLLKCWWRVASAPADGLESEPFLPAFAAIHKTENDRHPGQQVTNTLFTAAASVLGSPECAAPTRFQFVVRGSDTGVQLLSGLKRSTD